MQSLRLGAHAGRPRGHLRKHILISIRTHATGGKYNTPPIVFPCSSTIEAAISSACSRRSLCNLQNPLVSHLLTASNHNSLKRKPLPRKHSRPAPASKSLLGRSDGPLKLLLSRLRYMGKQCLCARIAHIIPFIGFAFLKTTPDEIHCVPARTARPLPIGRDSLGTRTCERGETATVEGKTRTASGEHFQREMAEVR